MRAQPGVPHGQPGHPGTPFGVGDVGDEAFVVDLLERERNRDDAAVEFRNRDLGRDIKRTEAVVVVLPLGAGTGQAQTLQDRDVECREVCDVPAVVVTACSDRCRDGTARGQHRHHHRVGSGEGFERARAAVRSDAQYSGNARPPADSMARQSDST